MTATTVADEGVMFPPMRSPGVMFGLSKTSTIWAGAGVVLFILGSMNTKVPAMVAGVGMLVLGAGSWDKVPLRSYLRAWVLRIVARFGGNVSGSVAGRHRLPKVFNGLEFVSVSRPGRWFEGAPVGVAMTGRRRPFRPAQWVASVVFEVSGQPILLMDDAQAKAAVGQWGAFVASMANSGRSLVRRVSWTDAHWPVSGWDLDDGYGPRDTATVDATMLDDYRLQADQVADRASEHRVFVTVTIDARCARQATGLDGDKAKLPGRTELLQIAVERAELLHERMEKSGFTVSRPLSPWQLSVVARRLADPSAPAPEAGSTEEVLGVSMPGWWPRTVTPHRAYAEMDGGLHAGFTVSLPQRKVAVEWLYKILESGAAPKTVTCTYEVREPAKSVARIERNLAAAVRTVKRKSHPKRGGEATEGDKALVEAWRQMGADVATGHYEVDVTLMAVLSDTSKERLATRVDAFDSMVRVAGGCIPTRTWHQNPDAVVAVMPFGVLTQGSDI